MATTRMIPRLTAICAILAAAALFLFSAPPAHAIGILLVSNIDQTSPGPLLTPGTTQEIAQAFTTTGSGSGSALGSVELAFARGATTPGSVTVAVWSSASNLPNSSVCALTTTDDLTSAGVIEFTPTSSCTLSASTKYFVYMHYSGAQADAYQVRTTESTSLDTGVSTTWTIAARYHSKTAAIWEEQASGPGLNAAAVKIRVRAPNTVPTAADNTVSTNEDTAHIFQASDFGFQDDAIDTLAHVTITTLPSQGTLWLEANDNDTQDSNEAVTAADNVTNNDLGDDKLRYSPPLNENGSSYTTFKFKVNDGLVDSASAYTITINVNAVNDAPAVTDETAMTTEDKPVIIDVLVNDNDVEGDTLSVSAVTDPNDGAVDNNGSNVTYTPNIGFAGKDTFDYTVSDGTDTGTGTVTVDVTPNVTGASGSVIVTYAENGTETVDAYSAGGNPNPTWALLDEDDKGDFTISDTGVLSFANTPDFEVPVDNDTNNSYLVTVEATADSVPGTLAVTVNITDLDETPVVSGTETITDHQEGVTAVGDYTTTAPDNGTITWAVAGADGDLFDIEQDSSDSKRASLSFLNPPDYESPDDTGQDHIYEVLVKSSEAYHGDPNEDPEDPKEDELIVTITVPDLNDNSPVANNDTAKTKRDEAVVIPVLANDTDLDVSFPLSVTAVGAGETGPPSNGDAQITGNMTTVTYTPDDRYSGTDTFDYTVSDGSNAATATVTVRVTSPPRVVANIAPTFTEGSQTNRSVPENTPAGQNIGAPLPAQDPQGNDLIYDLYGADASFFQIDRRTGQLTTRAPLDFETQSSYEVRVGLNGGVTIITVTVDLTNVDEPGVVELSQERAEVGVPVTATLSDPDGGVANVAWQWAASSDGVTWIDIPGATRSTYTPVDLDQGQFLRAAAVYSDGAGSGAQAQTGTESLVQQPSQSSVPGATGATPTHVPTPVPTPTPTRTPVPPATATPAPQPTATPAGGPASIVAPVLVPIPQPTAAAPVPEPAGAPVPAPLAAPTPVPTPTLASVSLMTAPTPTPAAALPAAAESAPPADGGGFNPWWIALIVVASLAVIGGGVYALKRRLTPN